MYAVIKKTKRKPLKIAKKQCLITTSNYVKNIVLKGL